MSPQKRREPHDNIPAKVAMIRVGSASIELAEAITMSAGDFYDGPRTVYLDAARQNLGEIRESLATVEAYIVAAQAEADRIAAARRTPAPAKRKARA